MNNQYAKLKPKLGKYNNRRQTRNFVRANWQIRAPEVRLINEKGEQIGVISIEKARNLTKAAGLDLVEIAPKAKPPVVKIIELSKYKYQQAKKEKEARKKSKKGDRLKEIQLSPFIGEADLATRISRAKKFAKEEDRLKIVVKFLGRQITKKNFGFELLDKVKEQLNGLYETESQPKFVGKRLILLMKPIKQNKNGKSKEQEQEQEQKQD